VQTPDDKTKTTGCVEITEEIMSGACSGCLRHLDAPLWVPRTAGVLTCATRFGNRVLRYCGCRLLMDTSSQSPLLFRRTPGIANAVTPAADSGKR
jgi:hypothetical protein